MSVTKPLPTCSVSTDDVKEAMAHEDTTSYVIKMEDVDLEPDYIEYYTDVVKEENNLDEQANICNLITEITDDRHTNLSMSNNNSTDTNMDVHTNTQLKNDDPEIYHNTEVTNEVNSETSTNDASLVLSKITDVIFEEMDESGPDIFVEDLTYPTETSNVKISQEIKALKTKSKSKGKTHKTKKKNNFTCKTYSCNDCAYKCVDRNTFVKHLRIHSGKKPFSCEFCEYKCITNSNLKIHERKHTGEKPFSCEFCKLMFTRKFNLKEHIRIIHNEEKTVSCQYCEYTCKTQSYLKCHLKVHSGERPFSCEFCDYTAVRKSNLRQHLRKHSRTGEKSKRIPELHKKKKHTDDSEIYHDAEGTNEVIPETRINDTSGHQNINYINKEIKLEEKDETGTDLFVKNQTCHTEASNVKENKLLTPKNNLRTVVKPKTKFLCKECNYKCLYRSTFNRHLKIHTGEKQFSCQFCEYRCISKTTLTVHLRKHTNEKPFSCTFCEYKCRTKPNLQVHIRKHTREKLLV